MYPILLRLKMKFSFVSKRAVFAAVTYMVMMAPLDDVFRQS